MYQSLLNGFLFFVLLLVQTITGFSQNIFSSVGTKKNKLSYSKTGFITNVGQYGNSIIGYEKMGAIKFGYEGFNMPVLFTTNGLIYLKRKIEKKLAHEIEQEKIENKLEEKENYTSNDKTITMQWVGANTTPEIIAEGLSLHYHTYGLLPEKASVFNKLTYKEIYPGIDIVYSVANNSKKGFEYSIIARPGADLSKIKMRYGGDIVSIKKDSKGRLVIKSPIDGIIESMPVCFYADEQTDSKEALQKEKRIDLATKITEKEINFVFPKGYDTKQEIIIDPFVSPLNDFTGLNSDKAYDIDYDYDGNIYVRGGGDYIACELAKYDKNGVLQWVFHGTLTVPSWNFGYFNGGWVVEKNTGKVFAGQGGGLISGGFQIIRLGANGLYDNYITVKDPTFVENWKMLWTCNGGQPQMFAAGGGLSSNINLSICTPPSPNLSPLNITGIAGVNAQDVADALIDPETYAMYSILSSVDPAAAFVNNRIYKHSPPYSSSTIAWSTPSGFSTLLEGFSRPYLITNNAASVNALAINSTYLFYWDGKNLKAFNKLTGNGVGTALSIPGNTALMQGGIAADNCNNVFVGDVNGIIKVYHFNGTAFDDAVAADISIPGNPTSSTYALVYDNSKKLIYACGQGYVASFDVSSYCVSQVYTINLNSDCVAGSATASLSPSPPAGSSLTYALYNGSTLVSSNTTGIFSSLLPNVNYTIRAIINQACSGSQFEKNFSIVAPLITTSTTPSTCTQNIGSISATGSSGSTPYTYSIDGINFQSSNLFSGLAVGTYTVTIKDAIGCKNTKQATVQLSGVNTVTVSAGSGATICEGTGTTLAATSNASSFSWTPTTGLSNPAILNPVASPVVTTKYYIAAVSGPCSRVDSVMVNVNSAPIANPGPDKFICTGKSTQLNGSGGIIYVWSPTTYLDNPGISNPNVINPLNSIAYTLNVTDGNGCKSLNSALVNIAVRQPEKLFVGNDTIIATNQPLRLIAVDVNNTGFTNYLWSPPYGLNDNFIKTPTAILDRGITYTVIASTSENCVGKDTINIKVYNGPEIYVPTAFTPDGNNTNDILKAFPVGLKEFRYFAVFNRYGQRVFYTTNPGIGWNGKVLEKEQNIGSYVWIAEGVDYKGNSIISRGTVVLIK